LHRFIRDLKHKKAPKVYIVGEFFIDLPIFKQNFLVRKEGLLEGPFMLRGGRWGLLASAETQDKVEGGLLLNVVVR